MFNRYVGNRPQWHSPPDFIIIDRRDPKLTCTNLQLNMISDIIDFLRHGYRLERLFVPNPQPLFVWSFLCILHWIDMVFCRCLWGYVIVWLMCLGGIVYTPLHCGIPGPPGPFLSQWKTSALPTEHIPSHTIHLYTIHTKMTNKGFWNLIVPKYSFHSMTVPT